MRDQDVRRLAALVRGGASYEQAAAAEFRDVNPEVLLAFKASVIELASEPGAVATIPPPVTAEDDREAMRRFFKLAEPRSPLGFTVKKAGGGR